MTVIVYRLYTSTFYNLIIDVLCYTYMHIISQIVVLPQIRLKIQFRLDHNGALSLVKCTLHCWDDARGVYSSYIKHEKTLVDACFPCSVT